MVAQKAQLQSAPANDTTAAPAASRTPSRKRGHEESRCSVIRRRQTSLESGSPSVVVSVLANIGELFQRLHSSIIKL